MKILRYLKGRVRFIRNRLFGIPREALAMKIADLEISPTTAQRLENAAEIKLVGEALYMTEDELLRFPNVGRSHVNRLKEALTLQGLQLKQPFRIKFSPGPPEPPPRF